MGVLNLRKGDLSRAISSFERALTVGAFADIPVGYAYVAFHLGYALALSGRIVEGLEMLEKTIALAESEGFIARHSLRLAYLGEVYLLAAGLTTPCSQLSVRTRSRASTMNVQIWPIPFAYSARSKCGGRIIAKPSPDQ
jgi:tetratricopeptide (TPR) repeat protein